jgi:hypothetical protein
MTQKVTFMPQTASFGLQFFYTERAMWTARIPWRPENKEKKSPQPITSSMCEDATKRIMTAHKI